MPPIGGSVQSSRQKIESLSRRIAIGPFNGVMQQYMFAYYKAGGR